MAAFSLHFNTMIPDDKKEEVRYAADMVDVISDHVKLRRSGRGFVGLCPFHNEKTPSFNVTPDLGIYKCFGCGAGGDVFNFVMEMEGVGFSEAVRSLAERYGVDIPVDRSDEPDEEHQLREGIYHALRFAGIHYHQVLKDEDGAEAARTYLQKRGYSASTIRKHGLGYALDRYDGLLEAARSAGINEQYLAGAGLIRYTRDNRPYDVFRGRLMFPIFNPSGKVIAFGGRVINGGKNTPKYINSSQTQVYDKSEVLYGIHTARNEIRKQREAILVEGYTDVLTLFQAGIGNVLASGGTSLTSRQMQVIHRYGEQLLMIYDSDAAGLSAMLRAVDVALEQGLAVRLLRLPEGEDPDSFVRQFGREGFEAYRKKEASDFVGFMIRQAERSGEWEDPINRQQLVSRIVRSIAGIPDRVNRDAFLQHLSQLTRIGDRALYEELEKVRAEFKRKQRQQQKRNQRRRDDTLQADAPHDAEAPPTGAPHPSDSQPEQPVGSPAGNTAATTHQSRQREAAPNRKKPGYEKELIRLMLVYGQEMIRYIGSQCNGEHFEDPDLQRFFEDIIQRFQQGETISVQAYAEREHPFPDLLGEVVIEPHELSRRGAERLGQELQKDSDPFKTAQGALKPLRLHYLERLEDRFSRAYQAADGKQEKEQYNRKLQEVARQRSKLHSRPLHELFPAPEKQANQ